MRRIFKRALVVVTVLGGLKLAWWLFFPYTWLHYKLSVDVDDNGVLRHGEGVIAVVFQSQGPLLIDNTPQWSVNASGEAFSVDIGQRGILFVLPTEDRGRNNLGSNGLHSAEAGRAALWQYFYFGVNDSHITRSSIEAFARTKQIVDVPLHTLPRLVKFRDLDDRFSAVDVDPHHLEKAFGAGVRIVAASAAITDEPVTTGIEKRLPWLGSPRYPQTGHMRLVQPNEMLSRDFILGNP